jgi:NAD(P)-dependent dehydrogenase (short-subunit alcohol dehydrogenase family)
MTFDPFADFRMNGHVAIVTGAAQNIGEAIARNFSGAGASGGISEVVFVADDEVAVLGGGVDVGAVLVRGKDIAENAALHAPRLVAIGTAIGPAVEALAVEQELEAIGLLRTDLVTDCVQQSRHLLVLHLADFFQHVLDFVNHALGR